MAGSSEQGKRFLVNIIIRNIGGSGLYCICYERRSFHQE